MLTAAPVLVHPTKLPTHLPPPPVLLTAHGTLLFPPGFIPPPFPAVINEEELHEATGGSISPDPSDSIFFSSSSSEASVALPLESFSLGNVTLNLLPLTGDEDQEFRMYAKAQGEVKAKRNRRQSTCSSAYSYSLLSLPMSPNTEIYYDTVRIRENIEK